LQMAPTTMLNPLPRKGFHRLTGPAAGC
jgi:hypothetical protein